MRFIYLDNSTQDFLSYRIGSGLHCVEIFDIQVGSERGVGKGRKLINLLIDRVLRMNDVHHIYAMTRETNEIARKFYEALGFRLCGSLTDFYWEESNNETCLVYVKDVLEQ